MRRKANFNFLAYFLFCFLCGITLFAETANLASSKKSNSCMTTLPNARKIYLNEPNNLEALHIIAECTEDNSNVNQYANEAKEIFEQSQILSIVPHLLEIAQIKDLIPILKEVEVKKDKSINDYLMLNELYERLGEKEKQMNTLKEALNASPNDPRPLLLLASKKMDFGVQDEANSLFKDYLVKAPSHPGQFYLMIYVYALIHPLLTALLLLAIIWLIGYYLIVVQHKGVRETIDMRIGIGTILFIIPMILAFSFWQTSSALPFAALTFILMIEIFLLAKPVLAKVYKPVFNFVSKVIHFVFNGVLLAKKLEKLSSGLRVIIALLALTILGTIVPTIAVPDLRYGVTFFCGFLFYATLGSLLVSFIRSRTSLLYSLHWIAIAATFPFLLSYMISNWNSLGAPLLFARIPSHKAMDSLFNYLLFWGVSLFLALHLGRILAEALLQPIREIMDKVARIEKGDWSAQVEVFSQDEIGNLGHAVNRMRSGLERREKVEKTFHKYIDKKIAERILSGIESEFRIEGTSTEAVVLFADIRGYTKLSEKTEASVVVNLLNQYFERMVRIVQQHGGVVDKFIGDNLMAVWGVPNPIEQAEQNAVRAALEMLKEIQSWSNELEKQGYPAIGIGIGINSGTVIAGSLGCSDHLEYTVIGDVVNSAQRAESHASKQELLITESVYKVLQSQITATPLESIKVKGKEFLQNYWSVTRIND